ncbi:unnamed protein product [Euphydryas editha]|uniref:Uncharacterized protein n=1 Tax=Euphydryas editha TaxID=104508 RepID=A0AAU9UTS5_EUPED|nr:unnamed protein product [Euphydryas editha]
MIGVASVAGIVSRNGRISSVGGIHFYPSMQNKMPNIDKKYKSSKQNKDLTGNIELGMTKSIPTVSKWRKESNGNMAEGFISFYPGSVSVSSSAVSSSKPGNIGVNDNSWADPFNPMIWPMNEPFNGPPRNFDYSRNIDWIHRDIFNNYVPPNLYLKRTWLYPTYNPFLN